LSRPVLAVVFKKPERNQGPDAKSKGYFLYMGLSLMAMPPVAIPIGIIS
jgi:hypothetical protein